MSVKTASSAAAKDLQPHAATRRPDEDTAAMASYIADMASELSHLAGRAEMPMVAYFLSLARVEAEMRSRELGGAHIPREK
ncbi:hypothetical protein F7D14_16600 [Methylocystis parvus]|uniref:Uncharacterized protein n=2 Tax=Methylocystis parvus TaxID=134 RepID=A0A6B8MDA0_9HYPH|nr:hypothetical protein F7D14_16600 [Methylocystis parvus]